jgi:3-hydroxy-9,10-secoandrosta-1,3,5(10)-triene-9,17-dione monooxygenase
VRQARKGEGSTVTTNAKANAPTIGAELIERARALKPLLAEYATETERLRQLSPIVVKALADADLFAVGAPVSFGGYDVDLDTMFEIGYELGQACGSTSWCWGLWSAHSWYMGYASPEAQADFYADGPGARLSSGVKPGGSTVERVDGGVMLSGTWGLSSGVDHADWLMLGANLPGGGGRAGQLATLMLVPQSAVTIIDDWYVNGLKGTGSKTVEISEPVFVPEHRFINLDGAEDGPAKVTHKRVSYGLPPQTPVVYITASPLVGAARGGLDALVDQVAKRRHSFSGAKTSESVGVQMRIAEAAAELDAAVQMVRADLRELLDFGDRGVKLTTEQRATYRLHHCYIALLARRAITRVFEVSGTAGMYSHTPVQRFFGDVFTGSKNIGFPWDEMAESYGRVRLGMEPNGTFS